MMCHELIDSVCFSHVISVDILNNSNSWELFEKGLLHMSVVAGYGSSKLVLIVIVLGCAEGPDEGPLTNTMIHD